MTFVALDIGERFRLPHGREILTKIDATSYSKTDWHDRITVIRVQGDFPVVSMEGT
jgi:hypothetical protein